MALAQSPYQYYFKADTGVAYSGGTITYWENNSSTTKAVAYQDPAFATPHAPDIAIDIEGKVIAYLVPGVYGVELKDADGVQVWRVDDYAVDQMYGRTAEEITAGIYPVNYSFKPGQPPRYGAVGNGIVNDTTALDTCRDAVPNGTMDFMNLAYVTDGLTFNAANSPARVLGQRAQLIASGAMDQVLLIENPHGASPGFSMDGSLIVDGNGTATDAVRIHGMQRCEVNGLYGVNAARYGFNFESEAGYGIYYNEFHNCHAGNAVLGGNGDDGFHIENIDSPTVNRCNGNTFVNCVAQDNLGSGVFLDKANGNTFIGFVGEINNGQGVELDTTTDCTFIGGYAENNHVNLAQGGTTDSGTDESFSATANTTRVTVLGGRHAERSGDWSNAGHFYLPGVGPRMGFDLKAISLWGEGLAEGFLTIDPNGDSGIKVGNSNGLRYEAAATLPARWDFYENVSFRGNAVYGDGVLTEDHTSGSTLNATSDVGIVHHNLSAAGDVTLVLPTLTVGLRYRFKNSNTTFDLIIDGSAAETIDGSATLTLTPGQSATIVCLATATAVTI